MSVENDLLIARAAEHNEGRMGAVVAAFAKLLVASWPETPAVAVLAKPVASRVSCAHACRLLLAAFDEIHRDHPTAAFWWKDEASVFLGACERFGPLAALPSTLDLLGLAEGDEKLGWARQSPIYRRDDREVLTSFVPKLNIVERQDRDGRVVWIRTSKAPYRAFNGLAGTVGGFDQISSAQAMSLAKR